MNKLYAIVALSYLAQSRPMLNTFENEESGSRGQPSYYSNMPTVSSYTVPLGQGMNAMARPPRIDGSRLVTTEAPTARANNNPPWRRQRVKNEMSRGDALKQLRENLSRYSGMEVAGLDDEAIVEIAIDATAYRVAQEKSHRLGMPYEKMRDQFSEMARKFYGDGRSNDALEILVAISDLFERLHRNSYANYQSRPTQQKRAEMTRD